MSFIQVDQELKVEADTTVSNTDEDIILETTRILFLSQITTKGL